MVSTTLRMKAESSTTSTRNFLLGEGAMGFLGDGRNRARGLRSYKLFDRGNQLILLHGFGQEGDRAFFDGAITVLCARARGDHHHGNAPGGGTLPQLNH